MSTVDLVRIMQDFLQQLEDKIWHLEGVLDLLFCYFSSSAVCFKKKERCLEDSLILWLLVCSLYCSLQLILQKMILFKGSLYSLLHQLNQFTEIQVFSTPDMVCLFCNLVSAINIESIFRISAFVMMSFQGFCS